MTTDFTRAMREATALTRGGRLADATRTIQAALGRNRGGGTSPMNAATAGDDAVPLLTGPQADRAPGDGADTAPSPAPQRQPRSRMRLGKVIDVLQRARTSRRFAGLSRDARPASAPVLPEGATFTTRSFTNRAGTRSYKLYLPSQRPTKGLPLIVMLHGCTQNPDDFATGTRMNLLAEEFGFVVAYPAQPATANSSGCWNWFQPKDQERGSGEPSIIAGLTRDLVSEYGLDPQRVFVAGLSAGGAMAAVMGATYPDVYAAIGVHSGLPDRAASDVVSAFAAMRGDGASAPARRTATGVRSPRVIVFHGESDTTVHPANGREILAGFDGAGAHHTESTIAGTSRTVVRDAAGAVAAEHWSVAGLGHAWSGGNPDGSFTAASGPDASREMVQFFLDRGK